MPTKAVLPLLAVFSLLLISLSSFAVENSIAPKQILIGVDGLSYQSFRRAQSEGLFKEFRNTSAHISTFPSMTDLAWSTIMQTPKLFGVQGRIKSVEAVYFDESSQSVAGDPRDYYRRLAAPKYYMNAFENFFNPYAEGLMYFPTKEVPKLEIRTVIDDLIAAKPKDVLTGYIGAVDSLAHTQKDQLYPALRVLDQELKRLREAYEAKGFKPEIILISDHGNVGRFAEGSEEVLLEPVDVAPIVRRAGLEYKQQLIDNKDVAIPLLALGSWAPVFVKDRKNIPILINEFIKEPWFDLATYLLKNDDNEITVAVVSSAGKAFVSFFKDKNSYVYRPVEGGNPLQIEKNWHNYMIAANQAFAATKNTDYPDALFRLIQSATQEHFDYPDVILTLKDGYYVQGSLGAFTKMVRTHGSLSAASSLGILASTNRNLPSYTRSQDVLPHLAINAKNLFQLEAKASPAQKVATGAGNYSQKRIFQQITRFVSDSRPYFVIDEIKSFMEALNFKEGQKLDQKNLLVKNFDLSKFDVTSFISTEDIGTLADVVLQKGDLEKVLQDPKVQEVREKISSLVPTKEIQTDVLSENKKYILPAKRAVMKMTQIPTLLQNSLVVQELPFIADSREAALVNVTRSFGDLDSMVTTAKNGLTRAQLLFEQIFKENQLEDRIAPEPLGKRYQRAFDEKVTVVYVPGIYNGIFDREIFSLGLNAIADDLGLRVISPPVYSTCASEVNGEVIINYLKEDTRQRLERGHPKPKYIVLAYSKGGVDTLEAFTQDPEFISNQVLAMVAIASPLQGSAILNKSDLPFTLVDALSEKLGPEICKSEKPAAKSVNPVAMQRFWRKNEKVLLGLTRYFSSTFVSTPEESHIWMKATKLIAQFDEPNDGIVTVSSSKFPETLKAIDLGIVQGDHLAGILSSSFNQKAYMKALIGLLAELKIDDQQNNLSINTKVILDARSFLKDRTYDKVTQTEGQILLTQVSVLKSGQMWPKFDQRVLQNTSQLNKILFPLSQDPADNYETKVKLPVSQLKYDPYGIIDVAEMGQVMAGVRVNSLIVSQFPKGIDITFDHQNMVHFRMDHQFNYESRSPVGLDDSANFGFIKSKFAGEEGWLQMRSVNNSIRMTTMAYRFKPSEYPMMDLKVAVTKGVQGADPAKGKTGIDDSAFQVWFSVREKNETGDRAILDPKKDKVILFGYYWGEPIPGENRKPGDIFEDWYSNKNIVIATLPEAKMLLLNDESMLGKAQIYKRNIYEDLKRAFPDRNIEDMEIVALTLQHDSNDAKDSSEAYFKYLRIMPESH